jgi:DNA-binding CsgD family transcriptional regulator
MLLRNSAAPRRPVRHAATPKGSYELRATIVETPELAGIGPLILVAIATPRRTEVPSVATLVARHGLTPREAEVALLLRQGKPNRAIAAALRITEHTARRHTERVLTKLGVSSRAAVASALAD